MRSIFNKVLIVFIVLILPLNILSMIQVSLLMRSNLQEVSTAEQSVANLQAGVLQTKMEHAVSLLFYFYTEDSDGIAMTGSREADYPNQVAKMKVHSKMTNLAQMTDGADGYFFYMPRTGDLMMVGSPFVKAVDRPAVIEQIEKESEGGGWHLIERNGIQYAALVVNLKSICFGAWIRLDKIAELVEKEHLNDTLEIRFSETLPEESRGWMTVSATANNLYLILRVKRNSIIPWNSWQIRMLFFSIFCFAIVPVLYVVIDRMLLRPLKKMNEANAQLEKGNQDYRIVEKARSKEFSEAYRSFNQMADHIQELRIKEYEYEMEKTKMQLRNLQLQIRPHFLQNTFSLI